MKSDRVHLNGRRKLSLYGCDRLTHTGYPDGIANSHFTKADFLDVDPMKSFDQVLMNPPFLASSRIPLTSRRRYRTRLRGLCGLPLTADIWAYVLVKSVGHLKPGG